MKAQYAERILNDIQRDTWLKTEKKTFFYGNKCLQFLYESDRTMI